MKDGKEEQEKGDFCGIKIKFKFMDFFLGYILRFRDIGICKGNYGWNEIG